MRFSTFALVLVVLPLRAALGWDGSQTPEPGLNTSRLLLFEDFEATDFGSGWPVYWGGAPGPGTVGSPSPDVFAGARSLALQGQAGGHESVGAGEYVPETAIDAEVYFRLYYRLQDGFSMGTCNQLKLFGIRGGATIEDTYGGAGTAPDGTDKFSALLGIHNAMDLHFYYYHPEQPGIYGENTDCDLAGSAFTLVPGRWYCLELMLRANTPGQHDGQLRAWVDDVLVGRVDDLRFRDDAGMKIRRFTVLSYFGGSGDANTSPTDQQTFVDNLVISHERVGCLRSGPLDGGATDGASPGDAAFGGDSAPISSHDGGRGDGEQPTEVSPSGPGGSAVGGCGCQLPSRGFRGVIVIALVLLAWCRRRRGQGG
jgi:hypothetical protein